MQRRTKINRRKRSAVNPSSSPRQETALELAKHLGLIGKAKHLPSDLSTNAAHLDEFAKPK